MCRRWSGEVEEPARVGQEIVAGVLCVYTRFEGMTYERDGGLVHRERVTCCYL